MATIYEGAMRNEEIRARLEEKYPLASRTVIPANIVSEVQRLYDDGKYLDAYHVACHQSPLQSWQGAEALVMAARLANNLSAYRLARLLTWRAHRQHPDNSVVALHAAYALLECRGPMLAWKHALNSESLPDCPDKIRADLIGIRARIAGMYRDFDRAWQLINRAFEIDPNSYWLKIEKATILQYQDRRAEALTTLNDVLVDSPWQRATVQYKARLLHIHNRIEEAIELLTQALQHNQSGHLALQLMFLKREVDDDSGMLDLLRTYEAFSPLLTQTQREWMAARRADALYLRGAYTEASEQAKLAKGEYYNGFASRLLTVTEPPRRLRLPVKFIQQDHNTCGPATLATIAVYHGAEVTMQSIVGAICYDGTYDYQEREWCIQNGFAVREFTVSWDTLRTVVDAGLPFALTTSDISSGHMQAVIGYDDLRETLFIQDPGEPHYREVTAIEFLQEYKFTGPRGMVILPVSKIDELYALDLPDTDIYDLNFALHTALSVYDRETAAEQLAKMESINAKHHLVLLGRLSLATFDGNALERWKCIELLVENFPEESRVQFWKLNVMRETARYEDRVAYLRQLIQQKNVSPVFYQELAYELAEDRRHRSETWRMLVRAHAASPENAGVLAAMGDWHWVHQRDKSVMEYYRFAASYSDKNEKYAQSWFNASLTMGATPVVLDWLRHRYESYGDRSSAPAITLASCLDQICQTAESLKVLDDALQKRPNDGELLLYIAELKTRCGLLEQAEKHLQVAKFVSLPSSWQRAQSRLYQRCGDWKGAQECWAQIVQREPLALDAHGALTHYLAISDGQQTAFAHLNQICRKFPHHAGLAGLRLRWLRDGNPDEALRAARRFVDDNPSNTWALRELALILINRGKGDEALRWSERALQLASDEYENLGVHGKALAVTGSSDQAVKYLKRAIEKQVNLGWAYAELVNLMHSKDAKRGALDFIRHEMIRQVITGDGLHSYRHAAYAILEPDDLVQQLREVWQARPDLWESWSVLIEQLMDAGDAAQAMQMAEESVKKFSLIPGAWRDLANLNRNKGDLISAEQNIQKALEINPDWTQAWLNLTEYQYDQGKLVEAEATLMRAIGRLPLESELRLRLAGTLWDSGRQREAWDTAVNVVVKDSSLMWGWNLIRQWAAPLQRENEACALAKKMTHERPGDVNSWLILAGLLPEVQQDEVLKAYDRAIKCQPFSVDAYDLKAQTLADRGRLKEASEVIEQSPWKKEARPLMLKGRLIWITAVKGDKKLALSQMLDILEKNGDYFWGWEQVALWAPELQHAEAWMRSAREMVRLQPHQAIPCGYAADVELRLGNKEKALEYLKRALTVDPGYAFAACSLVILYWEKRDRGELLHLSNDLLKSGVTKYIALTAYMLAAVIGKDKAQVKEAVIQIVRMPLHYRQLVEFVDNTFESELKNLRSLYHQEMDAAAVSNEIEALFSCFWIARQISNNRFNCWQKLGDWIPHMGQYAYWPVVTYLDKIAQTAVAKPHLISLVELHDEWLKQNTTAWGKVGYVFTNMGLYEEGYKWLSEGGQRSDVEGWMLANLMVCAMESGRFEEAFRVSYEAIEQGLQDGAWPMLVSMAALGHALQNHVPETREILNQVSMAVFDHEWKVRTTLAHCICNVLSVDAGTAKQTFKQQYKIARQTAESVPASTTALRHHYSESIKIMAHHAGMTISAAKMTYPNLPRTGENSSWLVPCVIAAIFILSIVRNCQNVSNVFENRNSKSYMSVPLESKELQLTRDIAPSQDRQVRMPQIPQEKQASDWFDDMMKRKAEENRNR